MTYDLANLIPALRVKIGDFSTPYRYIDDWLESALILGFKNLQAFWSFKYLIGTDNLIYRNADSNRFTFTEPPVLEPQDEYTIVLMAAIIVMEGSLENSAWNAASWKDAEIAFSNLEGFRQRNSNLDRLVKELDSLVTSPTKRLARPSRQSLPGYKDNTYENSGSY